jgi:GDPmannose 4,6-dehydratase
MKAIIFGANGQDGFYLSKLLQSQDINILKVSRKNCEVIGNVTDRKFVEDVIKINQPDYIFHLAANSTTRHEALFENHEAISTGTINILEAVYQHCPKSKVFLSGSAMQFENKGLPIDETTPFAALSSYAVSRIHSVYAARYYRLLGLKVYVGYFFNHDSPFRTEQHINQKIVQFAKQIAGGNDVKLEIGDITVKKEFNFAGDIVEAVWVLVNQDAVFEAVIGCGAAHSIEEWLELCFRVFNKNWREFISVKPEFQAEYEILVSKPDLIKSLGWEPKTSIEDLAKMMIG